MRQPPAIFLRPWAITSEGRRLILSIWSRGELYPDDRANALKARDGEPLDNTRDTWKRGVASVVPVYGPLFRHANLMTEISGATSYARLRKDFQTALEDTATTSIVLDFDSPGGEVDGCAEMAEAIYDARKSGKRVIAYVGGMAASAAFWLATACDEVIVGKTAFMGSLGVRMTLVDDSAAAEKMGIREIEVIAKVSPDKRETPVDDEVEARAQAHVDALAEIFVESVARFRGVSTAYALAQFGQGDVVLGEDCVRRKLADRIGSLEAVLAEMNGDTPEPVSTPTPNGAQRMSTSMSPSAAVRTRTRAEGAPPNDPPKGKAKTKVKAEGDEEAEDDMPAGDAEGDMPEGEAAEDDAPEGEDKDDKPDAEDDMPEGEASEDDDEEDEDDEDPEKKKKQEAAAKRSLAAKLGLPATASLRQVLLAAQATAVPAGRVNAMITKGVTKALAEADKKRLRKERAKSAERLVAQACAGGWEADDEDRAAMVQFATSNPKAAQKTLGAFVTANGNRYIRTAAGDERETSEATGTIKSNVGGFVIERHGSAFSAAAKKLVAEDATGKLTFEAAMDRVKREKPQLYQAYLNGRG